MIKRKVFWISFIKKSLLAVINIYLLFPIVNLFGPLNEFENLAAMEWFVVGTVLIALFVPFWFLWIPLQIGLVLFSYQQYFPHQETGLAWLRYQGDQLFRAFEQFFSGDLAVFPTNMALILILLLVSIATYLLINEQKPTYIALTCLVYLLILHVFTHYDFFPYLLQVLLMSVLLFGISQIPVDKGWRQGILSFSVVTLVGYTFTQAAQWGVENLVEEQQWVEGKSRNFQRTLDERGLFDFVDFYSSGGGLNRMGYSDNDSRLGGPVQQNFDQVFLAYDDDPHYWRIATKDLYTGRGWEDAFSDFRTPIDYSFSRANQADEIKDILIDPVDSFDYVAHTYQLTGIHSDETTFESLLPSLEIIPVDGEALGDYTLSVIDRDIDFEGLNQSLLTEEYMPALGSYLQLPNTIPDRVWDLAKDVTEGHETTYEKVRAIEQYLRSDAGLRYSLREASHLPEGAEYVDHFLFETLVGYCDNFSTAMVVMARMMGIPARWAKGFNSGVRHTDTDGEIFYEVSNANAHSWPEIFFPEHGWIPFEPTPAFNQPLTDFVATPSENTGFTGGADENELEWDDTDNLPTAPEDEEAVQENDEIAEDASEDSKRAVATEAWSQVIGVLIILMTIIAYLYRRKLYPHLIRQLIRLPFLSLSAKTSLVLSLFKLDRRKESHETFRQYFMGISKKIPYHQTEIIDFIELNEGLMYAPANELPASKEVAQKSLVSMIEVYRDLRLSKKRYNY